MNCVPEPDWLLIFLLSLALPVCVWHVIVHFSIAQFMRNKNGKDLRNVAHRAKRNVCHLDPTKLLLGRWMATWSVSWLYRNNIVRNPLRVTVLG